MAIDTVSEATPEMLEDVARATAFLVLVFEFVLWWGASSPAYYVSLEPPTSLLRAAVCVGGGDGDVIVVITEGTLRIFLLLPF